MLVIIFQRAAIASGVLKLGAAHTQHAAHRLENRVLFPVCKQRGVLICGLSICSLRQSFSPGLERTEVEGPPRDVAWDVLPKRGSPAFHGFGHVVGSAGHPG